ncbi:bcl-2-like protein 15 isoform X2 [Sceloporus undulatus]|uniref:bcl-2-like protein 15 isoform X2 n=1 Tax=Sceloporus undulatus TaxID=8520 RepID=UPI001C4D13B4|nr:bcl-2-like protein 15 isoform X2 [Sceloporus undulatus]XP_042318838.1 bcl-2-like protein 15 isoform X2 [Sceloporus undulatus]
MKLTFEEQTEEIVKALLYDFDVSDDESEATFRALPLRVAGSSESSFDAEAIARRLQHLGDQYNADVERYVEKIIEERSNLLEKFKETAEFLSRNSGLQYEHSYVIFSVNMFRCLVRKARAIAQSELLIRAINDNHAVRDYIERQGGWENFENRRGQNNH